MSLRDVFVETISFFIYVEKIASSFLANPFSEVLDILLSNYLINVVFHVPKIIGHNKIERNGSTVDCK
jgi:hypothetical protein